MQLLARELISVFLTILSYFLENILVLPDLNYLLDRHCDNFY